MGAILFLIASVVILVGDPISLVGYVICAALIRNYFAAVASAVALRLGVHFFVVLPAANMEQSQPNPMIFWAGVFSAFLAATITWLIADRRRRNRAQTSPSAESRNSDPP